MVPIKPLSFLNTYFPRKFKIKPFPVGSTGYWKIEYTNYRLIPRWFYFEYFSENLVNVNSNGWMDKLYSSREEVDSIIKTCKSINDVENINIIEMSKYDLYKIKTIKLIQKYDKFNKI